MNTPHVPMDDAHLKKYAANAAKEAEPEGTVSCRGLSRALGRNLRQVRRVREALNAWSSGQSNLPGAVEWLLDNHYLAIREGERARSAFRGGRPLRGTRRARSAPAVRPECFVGGARLGPGPAGPVSGGLSVGVSAD